MSKKKKDKPTKKPRLSPTNTVAHLTDACRPGVVSMTFHFPDTPTNRLTNDAVDPVAKIPETKVCAVRVEP